jgi:quinolinate synthase
MPDEFEDPSDIIEDIKRNSVDKDRDKIFYGECVVCGEVTHSKVKEVTDRKMQAGEVYYYVHPECSAKFLRNTSSAENGE